MTGSLIDISRTITEDSLVYPGDTPLSMRPRFQIAAGDAFNLLALGWSTHFLTHIDFPLHFFPEGASATDLPLERFVSDAMVIRADGAAVLPEHVPEVCGGVSLLFKTRNSSAWDPRVYDQSHVYISREAAEAIVARGANLAGIDYLSVDRFGDEGYPVHHVLLGAGVPVLEGIDLSGVEPGRYRLIALPLKIARGDGSPVRAVLVR